MGKIWVWREILAAPRYKVATSNLKRSAHMSPDTCKREPIDLVTAYSDLSDFVCVCPENRQEL